jgi:hypothetical protein
MIFFNIFAEKFGGKFVVFDSFDWKILIITLVFEKNANFFAENCRKSQKFAITTSTPVLTVEHVRLRFRPFVSFLRFVVGRNVVL